MISISSGLQNVIDNNREKVPIGMIWVYDTTNTVPSIGPFVRYYSGVDYTLSSELKRTQFENRIFNDWSNGIPAALSDYVTVTTNASGIVSSAPFSVYYSGYFYAETSGDYSFSVKVAGAVAMEVGGSSILTGELPYSTTETAYATGFYTDKPQFWSGYKNLDTGWHDFKLYYQWDRSRIASTQTAGPFISAFWTLSGQDPKVISASVLNYTPSFLQPTIISDYIYIDYNVDKELATTVSFEVPVTTSGSYAWIQSGEQFGYIKPNKLCKIFMGYVTQSGYDLTSGYTTNLDQCTDMVHKFTGLIDSAQISHSQSNSVLVVQCRDFSKKLMNALNENYPNKISYTDKVLNNIDPDKIFDLTNLTPMAWDRWNIKDVVEMMALHAGIDPVHINKLKWDTQSHFVMESNLNWPKTSTVDYLGIETKGSDPYIFTYEYGEKLQDQIKKVGDLIGYSVYFDETGDLVFKEPRAINAVELYEGGGYGYSGLDYGDWTLQLEFSASNRITIDSYESGVYATSGVTFSFSGVGFGIKHMTFPSGSDYTVNITRDSDLTSVYSSGFSTSGATVKYNVGKEFTRELPSDKYTATLSTTGWVRLESFEYYSSNPFKPVRTLYDDRDVSSVDLDLTDTNLRNEIIGVGQQIGDRSYLYSKAIDLDSISNPSAFNYVGDKRTFVLIEPTIQSQQRLNWMTSAILEKYRRNSRNITVSTQGLPQIQVNDPIGLRITKLDLNSDGVSIFDKDNEEVYYTTQYSSRLTRANYTTKLTLTSLKPIESWRPPFPINDYILTGLIYPRNNGSIFSDFLQETLNAPGGSGYDFLSNQAAFVSFKSWIDVDRLWVLIQDDEEQAALSGIDGAGGLFKKINVKDNTPSFDYVILTDNAGVEFKEPKGGVWLHNGGGERWGKLTVPTLANKFGDGQWIGQKSDSTGRKDGIYPIAIWAQFRTSNGSLYKQGVWVPQLTDLNPMNISTGWYLTTSGDNIYYKYTDQNQANLDIMAPGTANITGVRMPGFRVSSALLGMDMWVGSKLSGIRILESGRLASMSGIFDYHGYWNMPQLQSNCPTCDNSFAPNTSFRYFVTGINRLELTEQVSGPYFTTGSTPVPRLIVAADDGPFRDGDYVLVKGDPPNLQNEWQLYADGVYGGDRADLRALYNTMSPSGARWKAVQGWTPMSFDIITGTLVTSGYSSSKTVGGFISGRIGTQAYSDSTKINLVDNKLFLTKFRAPSNDTITGVEFIFSANQVGGVPTRVGIYSTTNAIGSDPGTLISQSAVINTGYDSSGKYVLVNIPIPAAAITSGTYYSIGLATDAFTSMYTPVYNGSFFTTAMGRTESVNIVGTTLPATYPSTNLYVSNKTLGYKIKLSSTSIVSGYTMYPGAPYSLKAPRTGLSYISDFTTGVFKTGISSALSTGFTVNTIANNVSWGIRQDTSGGPVYFDGSKKTITSPFHDLNYYTVKFNTPVKYLRVSVYEFGMEYNLLNTYVNENTWCDSFGGNCNTVKAHWGRPSPNFRNRFGYADMGTTIVQDNLVIYFSDAATRGDFTPAKIEGVNGETTLLPVEFLSGTIPHSPISNVLEVPTQWAQNGAGPRIPPMDYSKKVGVSGVEYGASTYSSVREVRGPALDQVYIVIEFMQAINGQKYWTGMRARRSDVGRIRFNPWAHSTLVG